MRSATDIEKRRDAAAKTLRSFLGESGMNSPNRRRSIRLREYDYSRAGAYFVTVCAKDRACLLGEIVEGVMRLNDAGRMVADVWLALSARFPAIDVDEFVVMPNHVHGIVVLNDRDALNNNNVEAPLVGAPLVGAPVVGVPSTNLEAGTRPAPTSDMGAGTRHAPTLGDIVGAFKSITTGHYIAGVKQNDWPAFLGKLWQRNYYEHIIRNEDALNRIRQYIIDNPSNWEIDRENTAVAEKMKGFPREIGYA